MPPQDVELQSIPSAPGSDYQYGKSNKKHRDRKSKSNKKSSNKTSNIYSEFDNIQEGGSSEDMEDLGGTQNP